MRYAIYTLGCKVNFYESEYVNKLLKEHNYIEEKFNDICDIYIINTCAVTNTADSKSMKMIRQARKRNPKALIIVMGCFIEKQKEDLGELEKVADIIIGTKDKSKIIELIEEYKNKQTIIEHLYRYEEKNTFEDMFIDNFENRTRAFVKIQDGCENFCSYCIIPFVRGKRKSKDKDIVIKEITSLVSNGYKEIVLTGIHTGSYGVDINTSFAKLLEEIVNIKGLKRLRISSIEITELNNDVLKLIKQYNIIVDHLHIPLQSGSDKILKLMNRKYDVNYYINKVNEIRKIRPLISITTDVIVGFPGEDDKDFLETIETVKKIAFSKVHVFPYSIREGTKAATMKDQVSDVVKKERARTLIEVSKELEIKYMEQFLGMEVEVLTEQVKDGYTYGHTSNFLYVKIPGSISHNTFVKVVIEEVIYPYLIGGR